MLTGAVNKRYDFQRGYRVLWIFEHENVIDTVLKALINKLLFEPLTEYFLLKHFPKLGKAFFFPEVMSPERKRRYYKVS